jgi:hypothetical protein
MTSDPNTAPLVDRLWESDAASALTNEAAREIERLREQVTNLRALVANAKLALGCEPTDGVCL